MLMRLLAVTTIVVALSVSMTTPTSARDTDICPHDPTVDALHLCVAHAAAHGHIDNAGIVRSLHAKLNAAGAAVDQGHTVTAANVLRAFVQELDSQAGTHIDAMAADHLRMHVEMVIDGLEISS